MSLDLHSLQRAVEAMEAVVSRSEDGALMASLDVVTRSAVMAGAIQHFAFSYELSWKFIQRWLTENLPAGDPGLPRTRKELFRMAARAGLIDDASPWFEFGDARNLTVHTYDEDRAQLVYDIAVRFVPYARALLTRLETLND